ncbi:hypothetical protein CR513_40092, partial [Mucuna pruriens]
MAAKVCGICTSVEHPTDMCPTLQETDMGSSRIKIGHLIANNMEDSHFGQDRIRGLMQLNSLGPHRIHIRDKQPRVRTQGNSPSLEDLMKQLATSNLEFQQSVSSSNMQFRQNVTTTIQDLKTQIRQLANTSAGSSNLPSQTIPNLRGNASVVTLRSGKELPQPTLQQLPRSTKADSEPNANS